MHINEECCICFNKNAFILILMNLIIQLFTKVKTTHIFFQNECSTLPYDRLNEWRNETGRRQRHTDRELLKENLLQVRFTDKVATVTDSAFKLPLFLKWTTPSSPHFRINKCRVFIKPTASCWIAKYQIQHLCWWGQVWNCFVQKNICLASNLNIYYYKFFLPMSC